VEADEAVAGGRGGGSFFPHFSPPLRNLASDAPTLQMCSPNFGSLMRMNIVGFQMVEEENGSGIEKENRRMNEATAGTLDRIARPRTPAPITNRERENVWGN
jgi:hypothetical protein